MLIYLKQKIMFAQPHTVKPAEKKPENPYKLNEN